MKNADSESATDDSFVFKSLAISTKPGKYMSIENGPSAAKEPKIRMRENLFCLAIMISFRGAKIGRFIFLTYFFKPIFVKR